MNEALSIKEAALALNVSQRSVWNYIKKGRLHKVMVDGKAHVSRESIERFSQVDMQGVKELSRETVQVVNESRELQAGQALVEVTYLQALHVRLGQLEAEKRYLLEYQADREKQEKELAEARARVAELEAELEKKSVKWWKRLFSKK